MIAWNEVSEIGGSVASHAVNGSDNVAMQLEQAGYVLIRQTGDVVLTRHSATKQFWIGTAKHPRQCWMMGAKLVRAILSNDMGKYCRRLT